MRKGEIQVGGFYTKNEPKPLFAREVIDDDGINFIYRDYSLSNGSPISTRSQCLHSSFATWAGRECTEQEKAICNKEQMEEKEKERRQEALDLLEIPTAVALFEVLDAIKQKYIVRYLEMKGYTVEKKNNA